MGEIWEPEMRNMEIGKCGNRGYREARKCDMGILRNIEKSRKCGHRESRQNREMGKLGKLEKYGIGKSRKWRNAGVGNSD